MSGEWLHRMDKDGLTPLDRAFRSGHMAITELMLQQEREDKSGGLKGSSPLHRAASLGLTDAVNSLLSYGARPTGRDHMGEIPLHKAAREGYAHAVEALLEVSDVNAVSSAGMTPLHWACLAGDPEIVRLLLRHGADRWLRNEAMDGLTPTDLAAVMGYENALDILGARPCFT